VRQLCELVGVTYGEFQSWYNYGEIRVSADRLVSLAVTAGEEAEPDQTSPHAGTLMEHLPQLSLEDEEGLLLVQLIPADGQDPSCIKSSSDYRTIYIPIDRVQRVIPLTNRAQRILEPRFEPLGIRLSKPYFHESARVAWFRMELRNAWRGGDALVGVLFDADVVSIGNELRLAVEGGIWKLGQKGGGPPGKTDTNWVSDAYKFTRHDPYDKGNVNYIYDAGVVLKACAKRLGKDNNALDSYRDAAIDIAGRLGPEVPLHEIVADQRLAEVATETKNSFVDAFPASLISLVIFLRWKEIFHKRGEEVDFQGLIDDSPKFVESAGFEPTVIAVWLFGCFAGYDRIAQFIYGSTPEKYSWFSGPTHQINKLQKPEKPNPEPFSTSNIGGSGVLGEELCAGEYDTSQSIHRGDEDAGDNTTEKKESTAKVEIGVISEEKEPTATPGDAYEKTPEQEDKEPMSLGQGDMKTVEEISNATVSETLSSDDKQINTKPRSKRPAKKKVSKQSKKRVSNSARKRRSTSSKSEAATPGDSNDPIQKPSSDARQNTYSDSKDAEPTPVIDSVCQGTVAGSPDEDEASQGQPIDSDIK